MAGEIQQFKLLYLRDFLKEMASPLDSINAGEFVHLCTSREGSSDFANGKIRFKSEEDLGAYKKAAMGITVAGLRAAVKQNEALINGHHYRIPNTDFCVDSRELDLGQYFGDKVGSLQSRLGELSVWDAIRISSVKFNVAALMWERVFAMPDKSLSSSHLTNNSFSYTVEHYLKPKVEALLEGEDNAAQEVIEAEAEKVLSVCQAQLSAGRVPEAAKTDVDQLVDETVKGLSRNFDSQRYLNIVDRLPLQHPACRIIAGVALAFAGLVLAAISITLAVHSFGVSTPLSAVGVAVGVDLMLAGFAMVAAAASLVMASSSVFFAKSQTKSEFMNHDPEAVTEMTLAARAFSKVAGG